MGSRLLIPYRRTTGLSNTRADMGLCWQLYPSQEPVPLPICSNTCCIWPQLVAWKHVCREYLATFSPSFWLHKLLWEFIFIFIFCGKTVNILYLQWHQMLGERERVKFHQQKLHIIWNEKSPDILQNFSCSDDHLNLCWKTRLRSLHRCHLIAVTCSPSCYAVQILFCSLLCLRSLLCLMQNLMLLLRLNSGQTLRHSF